MTYLEGSLEIMSPSRRHEVEKKQIARLLELFCLERDIPLYGYGSTTFRKEEHERGLEPDALRAQPRGVDPLGCGHDPCRWARRVFRELNFAAQSCNQGQQLDTGA